MTEQFDIKIIRMKSGEDIICFCFEDYKNNKIYIKYPKTFYFNYDSETEEEELILVDWMTKLAFAYQEVSIPAENILFTTYANIIFGYRYLTDLIKNVNLDPVLLEKIKSIIGDSEVEIEEQDIPENITLH